MRDKPDRELHVGFTGTREGMTVGQKKALIDLLKTVRATHLHHGDCVGSDAQAHEIALDMGLKVIIHPATNEKLRAYCQGAIETHEVLGPLERNKKIVEATKVLVATPKSEVEELRSGTWATVRYGHAQADHSVVIIKPSGSW